MPQFDNTNRGVVFVNERKERDSQPDMNGSINIEGTDYWLSGWWKTPQSGGEDFLSLSVKLKDGQQRAAPAQQQRGRPAQTQRGRPQQAAPAGGGSGDDDSDIPFAPMYPRKAWAAI